MIIPPQILKTSMFTFLADVLKKSRAKKSKSPNTSSKLRKGLITLCNETNCYVFQNHTLFVARSTWPEISHVTRTV